MSEGSQRKSLIAGFLNCVRHTPQNPALELGDLVLSYRQLWEHAGRITACLNSEVSASEKLVALWAGRSVAAYSGILGILASGRGYVPLNPKFPLERTLYMLKASRCRAVIVGQECQELVKSLVRCLDAQYTFLAPDEAWKLDPVLFSPHRLITARSLTTIANPVDPRVQEDDIAYLLFTSGSTGLPKGVTVGQSNVAAYMAYAAERFGIRPGDRCSQNFDLTFDLSVHDLFTSWNAGATLCPFIEQTLTPATLIDEKELSVWFSVPSVAMFASRLGMLQPGVFPSLRWSLFCGEALPASLAATWQEAANNSILENLYGPTEATIAITHYRWSSERSPGESAGGLVPIGWPFAGQQVRVVDEELNFVPEGEVGELCLSGSQVTPGYLNDPAKTAKSFVRLRDQGDNLWYRTGDLVRQDERGCLSYIGRRDFQVKINGYRVELQEIELVLRAAARTEMAVAVPWPFSDGSASGVVGVITGSKAADDKAIISACESRLPRYMVPSRIYHLERMPLNVNGKIDRPKISEMLSDWSEA